MKASIKKNYLYNLGYQIIVLLTPLITTPYISRVLQPEGVGVYSYTYSIVSYFTLFAVLGTNTFGQRQIAYCQDEANKYSKVFWEVMLFRCSTGLISVVAYFIYLSQVKENHVIAIMQGIYIVYVVLDLAWFFQGLEEFKKLVIRNILIKIAYLVFIFTCIKSIDDLELYVFGLATMNLLASLSMWSYLPKYLKHVNVKDLHPFSNFKEIIQLFIPAVAVQVYTVLDKTMIGVYTDLDVENGYYEQAEKLVKMSLAIVTSLGTVMVPRMSYTFEKGDIDGLKKYLCKSYRFVWFMATPIFVGLIAISDLIVPWFLGDGYEKCVVLIQIFSILLLAIGFSNVTGTQYLIPTRQQTAYTRTIITGAVVNLLLNLVLIPRFYSVGAALASVTAEIVIAVYQLYLIASVEKIIRWRDPFRGFWRYIVSALVMFAGIEFLEGIIIHETIAGTFSAIFVGVILYFTCLLLLNDAFFYEIIKSILKKIKG